MKLPQGHRADLGTKLEDYALNPVHREGKHKARLFDSVLGITRANADLLLKGLRQEWQILIAGLIVLAVIILQTRGTKD